MSHSLFVLQPDITSFLFPSWTQLFCFFLFFLCSVSPLWQDQINTWQIVTTHVVLQSETKTTQILCSGNFQLCSFKNVYIYTHWFGKICLSLTFIFSLSFSEDHMFTLYGLETAFTWHLELFKTALKRVDYHKLLLLFCNLFSQCHCHFLFFALWKKMWLLKWVNLKTTSSL